MDKPTILYEDNHVIVAIKPPNLLTQSDATGDESLLDQVKAYVKEACNKPGEAYIGLVHRMDRPVGGLLCFARTSKAASRLSEQVRVHELNRQYVCIVEGDAPDQFTYVDYLVKDEEHNRVAVLPSYLKMQGKEAILHGRTIARRDGLSLVAIQLETGRAHQIRVQMASRGLPLYGDRKYNPDGKILPAYRNIGLYSHLLGFSHPVTGKWMEYQASPESGIFLEMIE